MMTGQGLLFMFVATDAFVVAMLLYDRWARGKFHPATVWGGLVLGDNWTQVKSSLRGLDYFIAAILLALVALFVWRHLKRR